MLSYWKLRIYFEFYGAKSHRNTFIGMIISVLGALPGLFKKAHLSRLQTAFKYFVTNSFRMLKSQFQPRWMPIREELEMFNSWPELFASTMLKKAEGAPELKQDGKINFMNVLKIEHASRTEYPAETKVEV